FFLAQEARSLAVAPETAPSPPEPEPREVMIFPEILKPQKLEEERPYVRTTQNAPEDNSPDRTQFQSDRNTTAATELPPDPDGDKPLPTQQGEDLPAIELERREYTDGKIADDATQGAPLPEESPAVAQNDPAPPEPPEPEPLKPRLDPPLPDPDQQPTEERPEEMPEEKPMLIAKADPLPRPFAIDDPTAEPMIEETPEPTDDPLDPLEDEPTPLSIPKPEVRKPLPLDPKPAMKIGANDAPEPDVFQPQTRKHKIAGTISNRGDASVNAEATPIGRYMRQVTGAIEKRWHRNRQANGDFVTYCSMRISFHVNKEGKPEDLTFDPQFSDANAVIKNFTLDAILNADIPPIPEEIRGILNNERVEITYDVIIY
ncbi:MAG: hypothetical protein R3F11_21030, partial [Verrucomicrobiales bacterium]